MQCMSSVSAESFVEKGGKGCVSEFWTAEAFPEYWPLGTVN